MAEENRHRTSVLKKCGFHPSSKKSQAPEQKWVLVVDGLLKLTTACPKGRGEIAKGTFGKMLKQLVLTREQYMPLYSCKKQRSYYFEILRASDIDV